MKSKLHVIYTTFVFLLLAFLLIGLSDNPPNGRTGAPGESHCGTSCHTGSNPQGLDGDIQIIGLPATISPNNTYTISVIVTNPNGLSEFAGFQMVALDSNNQNAGTMSNPSTGSTITILGNGKSYHEHAPHQPYDSNNQVVWTVDWTSPQMPDNELITFYAAGNITDMNSWTDVDNDFIVLTNVSGTLSLIPPPSVSVSTTDVLCFGGSSGAAMAVVTGGTAPFSFEWSNGDTTQTINNLPAGNYIVTITDTQGNTATAMVDIFEPSEMLLDITTNDVTCFGGSDGAVEIFASGGTPGYTFQIIHNNDTTNNISNLVAGNYIALMTDANGCQSTLPFEIEAPPMLDLMVDSIVDEIIGVSGGAISITPSGGIPPYQFDWQMDGTSVSTDEDATNLAGGEYIVIITDAHGCTLASPTLSILSLVNSEDLILENAIEIFPNPATDFVNLKFDFSKRKSITVEIVDLSGKIFQQFFIENFTQNPTQLDISNLPEGLYLLTVSTGVASVTKRLVVDN